MRKCLIPVIAITCSVLLYFGTAQRRLNNRLCQAIYQSEEADMVAALNQGADPFAPMSAWSRYPRMPAVYYALTNAPILANALEKHGVKFAELDDMGIWCLHSAISRGNVPVTRVFLSGGIDANYKSQSFGNGVTLLMLAANSGQNKVLTLLLEHGGDPMRKDHDHRTTLDWARQAKNSEGEKILREWTRDLPDETRMGTLGFLRGRIALVT